MVVVLPISGKYSAGAHDGGICSCGIHLGESSQTRYYSSCPPHSPIFSDSVNSNVVFGHFQPTVLSHIGSMTGRTLQHNMDFFLIFLVRHAQPGVESSTVLATIFGGALVVMSSVKYRQSPRNCQET